MGKARRRGRKPDREAAQKGKGGKRARDHHRGQGRADEWNAATASWPDTGAVADPALAEPHSLTRRRRPGRVYRGDGL